MEREVNVEKVVVIGTGTMAAGIDAGFINAGFACVFLGRQIRQSQAVACGCPRVGPRAGRRGNA